MKLHNRLLQLLAGLYLIGLFVFTTAASAQFVLPQGSDPATPSTELETLVEQARKTGSTVIVIQPDGKAAPAEPVLMDGQRSKRFFEARKNLTRIIGSAQQLPENMIGTLREASPDGSWLWLIRAIGTALLGIMAGYFASRPIIQWVLRNGFPGDDADPETNADKIKYLLTRVLFAIVALLVVFAAAMVVAVMLDSGHEPSRRVIFEIVASYCVYRFLRHGVSWNLFSGGIPKFRMVNLSDEEAVKLHRDFHISVAIACVNAAVMRFFTFTGADQLAAGFKGGLTSDNIQLLQLYSAVLVSLLIIIYLVRDWKAWRHIFAPAERSAPFYKLRCRLAGLMPVAALIYSVAALGVFAFRLALKEPAPGVVLAAPFGIFYAAVLIYGVVLIVIQAIYRRRINRYEELAAAEQERQRQEAERLDLDEDEGEEMVRAPSSANFEYQPMFRSFFENAALAIIITVSLGELGRIWGIEVGRNGNVWAALLDITLAAILCWLAYHAITVFIDKRMAEEGGTPVAEEEPGGEGGGAGATRMATLLPIFKYVMVSTLFFVSGMIILSRMGFDIGPIFAGAGVVGIAVGFGAQTLIRDIFSGAFFLLDDAFRKGEYVDIEGVKGTVEKISVRSFQLRHHLGALHTIPFGEIKQLTNFSRDWVLMKLPLRVTYDTDVEKVRKLVKRLGQELLDHPQVGHTFMQPLKSQGVYRMEDSAMIIRVKFMTKPGEQFVTRKVVYESIQDLFAREGIHFAHKEVTVRLADSKTADELTEEEQKAVTAAARSVIDADEEVQAGAGNGSKAGGDGR